MVPIRVELEGFLSYQHPQVLTFDGSPLWMLSGPNGAGKSSVFDAITYSLYGLHRGGQRQYIELINHHSEALMVQFDFALGDEIFRIKRTHSRRKTSSRQAYKLVEGVPIPIAETDMEKGFDKWVSDTLGLDDKAFTTSVLLQQNKSDALLAADPSARHKILLQIVDLSAYQKLHEDVKSEHAALSGQSKRLDSLLLGMDRVDPSEIARLGDGAQQARQASQACVEKLQELAALRVHARAWQKSLSEKRELDSQLLHVRGLLDRAEQIARSHERWSELKIHLPIVERALSLQSEAQALASKYLQAQSAAQAWQLKRDAGAREAQAARDEAARLKAEAQSWRARGEAASETLESLAGSLREVEALDDLEAEAGKIQARLGQFAPDFEAEIEAVRGEHAELAEISAALPGLKQFGRARASWEAMKLASDAARESRASALAATAELEAEAPPLQAAFERDDLALEAARSDEVRVRALLKSDRERAAKLLKSSGLEALAPDATCDRCGSPLDALHLEEERARREALIDEMMHELALAEKATEQARARREASKQAREEAERAMARAQDDLRKAEGEIRNLKGEALTLCGEVERVIEGLPERFRERFSPQVGKASEHFKNAFPSADELRALANRATKQVTLDKRLQVLAGEEKDRDALQSRLEPLLAKLEPLAQKYSRQERARLRAERDGARATVSMARGEAGEAERQQSQAEAARDDAMSRAESAARTLAQAELSAGRDKALEEAKLDEREGLLARLEADWKVLAQAAHEEDAARLRRELASLKHAPDELSALNAARESLSAQVARSGELEQVLAATPPEHQREEEEVAQEEVRAHQQKAQADATAGECEAEKQQLQSDANRRQQIAEESKQVSKAANLHKSLAAQLGPDALQRYLLQQAEALIVENANRLLDTMSGGVLQLQLKASEEAPAPPNGKPAAPKALELLAINQATGGRAMPVEFLSGSQKFRVAVALALGIGQFASGGGRGDNKDGHQGSRRIESVIIDEGFGSLDQEGRENIVNELRELGSILKRVIVVSHQEELARAFPSRYEITLQDGSSRAQIIESQG